MEKKILIILQFDPVILSIYNYTIVVHHSIYQNENKQDRAIQHYMYR